MSIYEAYFKFQNIVQQPVKDGTNPAFKNSAYVTIDGLMEVVKPALKDSGLIMYQVFGFLEGSHGLRTVLQNKTGETIESFIPVVPEKTARVAMQGFGSATTYTRRYAIEAICGLCGTVDDDGNNATGTVGKKKAKQDMSVLDQLKIKVGTIKDQAKLKEFLASEGINESNRMSDLAEMGQVELYAKINREFK